VFKRGDVVRYLHYIVDGNSGGLIQLEEEQVRKRRLRPLDLGGKHSFLPNIGIEQKRPIRQERRDPIETAKSEESLLQRLLEFALENKWGNWG
jgi:hypothetical protein